MLPEKYKWLLAEGAPKMLVAALSLFGVTEIPGKRNNPTILSWAKRLKIEDIYTNDEIAWCGLFMAIVALSAGKTVAPGSWFLWALNWRNWGTKVEVAMLGDVLTFTRTGGGGHVGLYVGEDNTSYHVLGGNQGDQVSITRILKTRCAGIRRPVYSIGQPANVRKIILSADGVISTDER